MAFLDRPLLQPGTELKSGSPEYTAGVVQNAQRTLKAPYQAALESLKQSWANKGQLEGGMEAQGEMGLTQSYLDQLANVSEKAALRGADVAEENRRRNEERTWNVTDLNRRYDELAKEAEARKEASGNAMWGPLIGQGADIGGKLLMNYLSK